MGKSRSPSARGRKQANPDTEPEFGKSRTGVRSISVVAELSRARWPKKTAIELALRADVSQRQAEKLLAGTATPSGETLASLITSDAGFALLAALMEARPADERPAWWRRVKRQMELSDLRASVAQQMRAIERMEAESGEVGR